MPRPSLTAAGAAACLPLLLTACSETIDGVLACGGLPDTLLVPASPAFVQVAVVGDTIATSARDPGMAGMESLYAGAAGGTRSEILVNFGFSAPPGDTLLARAGDPGNLRGVTLELAGLRGTCAAFDTSYAGAVRRYVVHSLAAPFDPDAYRRGPGPAPAPGEIVSEPDTGPHGCDVQLWLDREIVAGWIRGGSPVGLAIAMTADSDSGLVAFASRELVSWYELAEMSVLGSVLAPHLVIRFVGTDDRLVIAPLNDTSTFSVLAAGTAGEPFVRTGLRSYPVFTYDLPELPAGRHLAGLWIVTLPGGSGHSPLGFWPLVLDPEAADWGAGTIRDGELAKAVNASGRVPIWPAPEVLHVMYVVPDPTLENRFSGFARPDIYYSLSPVPGGEGGGTGAPPLRLLVCDDS